MNDRRDPANGDNSREHRERTINRATFVIAGLLAAIILAAIGYGIFNASQVTSTIPRLMSHRGQAQPNPAPPHAYYLRLGHNDSDR